MPKSGQREWDIIAAKDKDPFLAMAADGLNMQLPPQFSQFEPRMRPHPLATKLQVLHYDQAKFDALDKTFVFAEKWFNNPSMTIVEDSPIRPIFDRVSTEPGWTTHSWPYGHDLVGEAPEQVLELILEVVGR